MVDPSSASNRSKDQVSRDAPAREPAQVVHLGRLAVEGTGQEVAQRRGDVVGGHGAGR